MKPESHRNIADRIKQAQKMLQDCRLCPRACSVDRTAGENGYCGLDDKARCFRELLHFQEEKELIPSHQVYFTGCNLKCTFCTVPEWNAQPDAAQPMDMEDLAKIIQQRQQQGARTLNLLGGEPTVNIAGILKLLERVEPETTVVWNSNMYYDSSAAELLTGLVDIYLADFKCGNGDCAENLLEAADYVETVKQNLLWAKQQADIIIRHVLLPGHTSCCLEPILNWVAQNMPDGKLSLRGDYAPPSERCTAPAEYLSKTDLQTAHDKARALGLNLIQ